MRPFTRERPGASGVVLTGEPLMKTVDAAALLLAGALSSLSAAAWAQPPAFAGRWVISGAVIAPWAVPGRLNDRTEERRLIGRSVVFAPRAVTGPEPLGCRGPVYKVRADPPDMIFEGELAEPDDAGRPRDAPVLARALGMRTPTVPTLETGCSEISFHRFEPDTLVFGLNDRVYRLTRAGPAPH